MRNVYTLTLILLAFLFLASSCERRLLEDENFNYASVIIEVDWSQTSLTPEEATVIFYPENGSTPRYLYLSSNRSTIKLPPANYAVIVVNNKFEDFDVIAFRNEDRYSTIEAYVKPALGNNSYMRSAGEITGDTPDILASDSRDCFTVSQKMVDETRSSRALSRSRGEDGTSADLLLRPVEVVAETRLTVHIQNMYLIRNGSHSAAIRGFAESVTLHNRKTTHTQVTHLLKLPYAEYYPNDEKNGFMRDHFSVLGFSSSISGGDNPVYFVFQAVLRDKDLTQFSYEAEVTNFVEINVTIGVKISIDIGIDPDPVGPNPPIPIPPVEPDDSDAFKPNVEEWEEVEVIKPMT